MTTIDYWQTSAKDDFSAAEALYSAKKYHQALFFVHLAIEKALKATHLSVHSEPALPIHDLNRLANLSGVTLSEIQKQELTEISRFNIAARYDDIKFELYKKATPEYTNEWMKKGKILLQYLLKTL